MKRTFRDSAIAPIIAWDFDGTINVDGDNTYPTCGRPRKYAKDVMNLLHNIGVRNVIWTSRDVAYNQDEKKLYDHITPMIEFLDGNGFEYDAINKSVQFAPYAYNGRKIYAHMYVDDRAFGWKNDDGIMLDVLESVAYDILGIEDKMWFFPKIIRKIINEEEIDRADIESLRLHVEYWRD
jgi:hypothetical protein